MITYDNKYKTTEISSNLIIGYSIKCNENWHNDKFSETMSVSRRSPVFLERPRPAKHPNQHSLNECRAEDLLHKGA